MRCADLRCESLFLIRHALSIANDESESGQYVTSAALGTHKVPLSDLGAQQAAGLSRYFKSLPHDQRPDAIISSPYSRAKSTANAIGIGIGVRVDEDERLREQDWGNLEGITHGGLSEWFPMEANEQRQRSIVYYRPPGGESLCEVILRVREFLRDLRDVPFRRIAIVTHQMVIPCFQYVIEGWTSDYLADTNFCQVTNASVTKYDFYGLASHFRPSGIRLTYEQVVLGAGRTERLLSTDEGEHDDDLIGGGERGIWPPSR